MRAPIRIYCCVSMGWEVVTIDDAAILKRAKELCDQDGVAWDCFSAMAPGVRVLTDRDRRECLMRARYELVREAVEAGPLQGEKPLADKGDAAINPMPIGTSELVEKSAIAPPESATLWPRRRVA